MEDLSRLDSLIKDGYELTVTDIKDVMSNLAHNDDVELFSRDVKKRLLDHFGDLTSFSYVLIIASVRPRNVLFIRH